MATYPNDAPTRSPRRGWIWLALILLLALSLGFAASRGKNTGFRYLHVFEEAWNLTRSNYVESVDQEKLLEGAYRGMVGGLDAASAYLKPGEEEILSREGSGRAGMVILPTGGAPMVVYVQEDGPASAAGLSVGDQLWKIGEYEARFLAWPLIDKLLTGSPGEKVSLSYIDNQTFKRVDAEVVLAEPSGPGYEVKAIGEDVLHIRLFDPHSADPAALEASIATARAQHPDAALLLDLRAVVGLDLEVLTRWAGLFYPAGELLRLQPRQGESQSIVAPAGESTTAPRVPVGFVLVDGATGGVGEAFALLVQEQGGARICGRKTYGLGSLPEIVPLRNGAHLLLTTRVAETVKGTRWADEGIAPQKVLTPEPPHTGDAKEKRDRYLDAAVEWIRAGAPVAEGQSEAA